MPRVVWVGMRWSEIPVGARRYILYHTIISPLLITWYMLPLYMFMTGYDVLEVGAFFTVVNLVSIPTTYLVGRAFKRIPVRHGLVLIDALDGVSCAFYALAYGALAPVMLFVGMLIEKLSGMFYSLYQAAERILYPKERLEEVFAWHMRLPEVSQLIGFLALGYLFGHVLTTPDWYRVGFAAFSASSLATIAYLLKALPRMDVEERVESGAPKFRVDAEFRVILLIEALLTLAWGLAPDIVMLNYVVNVLGFTLFEAMLVEASISLGAITATYVSERIGKESAFKAMSVGYALVAAWAAIMLASPPLLIVIAAYFICRFGETLAFPFYRAWIFRKVPKAKATEVFAALSSYRRVINVVTPVIAGALATISATLPYLASLTLFTALGVILLTMHYRLR